MIVARREDALKEPKDELESVYSVDVKTVAMDLGEDDAPQQLYYPIGIERPGTSVHRVALPVPESPSRRAFDREVAIAEFQWRRRNTDGFRSTALDRHQPRKRGTAPLLRWGALHSCGCDRCLV